MKKLAYIPALVVVLFSCSESNDKVDSTSDEVQSTEASQTEATPDTVIELSNDAEAKADADTLESTSKPKISFEETEYYFGKITEGEEVKHTFDFTNTGEAPLVINDARASCGCTVPDWPQEPIMPGESKSINVVFNSSGKKGTQNKTITLKTNISEEPVVLRLKGEVEEK